VTAPADFASVWNETRERFIGTLPLTAPVAAALLFLPQLLIFRYAPDPGPNPAQVALPPSVLLGFGVALVCQLLAQLFASLTVVGRRGQTVAEALALAARRAPAGLAASVGQSLALVPGLVFLLSGDPVARFAGLLLLVPGAIVALRLMLSLPAIAERGLGPIAALRRAWDLSTGQVLRIAGQTCLLLVGLLLVFLVVSGLGAALAAMGTLAGGEGASGWTLGRWLSALVTAAAGAGMTILFAQFVAVLYRRLAG
jgi:hypothetical protein